MIFILVFVIISLIVVQPKSQGSSVNLVLLHNSWRDFIHYTLLLEAFVCEDSSHNSIMNDSTANALLVGLSLFKTLIHILDPLCDLTLSLSFSENYFPTHIILNRWQNNGPNILNIFSKIYYTESNSTVDISVLCSIGCI